MCLVGSKETFGESFWDELDKRFFQAIPPLLVQAIAEHVDLGPPTVGSSVSGLLKNVCRRGRVVLRRGPVEAYQFYGPWEAALSQELLSLLLSDNTTLFDIEPIVARYNNGVGGVAAIENGDAIVSTLLGIPLMEGLDDVSHSRLKTINSWSEEQLSFANKAEKSNVSSSPDYPFSPQHHYRGRPASEPCVKNGRSDQKSVNRRTGLRLMISFSPLGFQLKAYSAEFAEKIKKTKDWVSFLQLLLPYYAKGFDAITDVRKPPETGGGASVEIRPFFHLGSILVTPQKVTFTHTERFVKEVPEVNIAADSCLLPRWFSCPASSSVDPNSYIAESTIPERLTDCNSIEKERVFLLQELHATVAKKRSLLKQIQTTMGRYRHPCLEYWDSVEESMIKLYTFEIFNSLSPGYYAYNLSRQCYDLMFLRMLYAFKGLIIPSWWTEQGLCSVCGSGIAYDEDPVVFCDACFVPVHHGCVGYPVVTVTCEDIPTTRVKEAIGGEGAKYKLKDKDVGCRAYASESPRLALQRGSCDRRLDPKRCSDSDDNDWYCDACHIVIEQVEDMMAAISIIRLLSGPRTVEEFTSVTQHERAHELPPSMKYIIPRALKEQDLLNNVSLEKARAPVGRRSCVNYREMSTAISRTVVPYDVTMVPKISRDAVYRRLRRRTRFGWFINSLILSDERAALCIDSTDDVSTNYDPRPVIASPLRGHKGGGEVATETIACDGSGYFSLLHSSTLGQWTNWLVTLDDDVLQDFYNTPHHGNTARGNVQKYGVESRMGGRETKGKSCIFADEGMCDAVSPKKFIVTLPHCSICGYDAYSKGGGVIKKVSSNRRHAEFCHVRCVIAARGTLTPLALVYDARRLSSGIPCAYCQQKGPDVMRCHTPNCSVFYHMPCATLLRECCTEFVDGRPLLYCPVHSKQNLPIQSLRRYQAAKKRKREKSLKEAERTRVLGGFPVTCLSLFIDKYLSSLSSETNKNRNALSRLSGHYGLPRSIPAWGVLDDVGWSLLSLGWEHNDRSLLQYNAMYLKCVPFNLFTGFLYAALRLYTCLTQDPPDRGTFEYFVDAIATLSSKSTPASDRREWVTRPPFGVPNALYCSSCYGCYNEMDKTVDEVPPFVFCVKCGCCVCIQCFERRNDVGIPGQSQSDGPVKKDDAFSQSGFISDKDGCDRSVGLQSWASFLCYRCTIQEDAYCSVCGRLDGFLERSRMAGKECWIHGLCSESLSKDWISRNARSESSEEPHSLPLGGGCVYCSLTVGSFSFCGDSHCDNIFHISCCYLWGGVVLDHKENNLSAYICDAYCIQHRKEHTMLGTSYFQWLSGVSESWCHFNRSTADVSTSNPRFPPFLIRDFLSGIAPMSPYTAFDAGAEIYSQNSNLEIQKRLKTSIDKGENYDLTVSLFEQKCEKNINLMQQTMAKVISSDQIALFRKCLCMLDDEEEHAKPYTTTNVDPIRVSLNDSWLNVIDNSRKALEYANRLRVLKLTYESLPINILQRVMKMRDILKEVLLLPRVTKRLRPLQNTNKIEAQATDILRPGIILNEAEDRPQPPRRRRGRPRKSEALYYAQHQSARHVPKNSDVKPMTSTQVPSVAETQFKTKVVTPSKPRRSLMSHSTYTHQGPNWYSTRYNATDAYIPSASPYSPYVTNCTYVERPYWTMASDVNQRFFPSGLTSSDLTPLGLAPSALSPRGLAHSGLTTSGLTPRGLTPSGLVPSGLVPSGLVPSGLVPSGLIPSGLVPSGLVPSGLVPSGLAPSGLVPSSLVRSGLAPSGVAPSGLVPSDLAPSGLAPNGVAPSGLAATSVLPHPTFLMNAQKNVYNDLCYHSHVLLQPQYPTLVSAANESSAPSTDVLGNFDAMTHMQLAPVQLMYPYAALHPSNHQYSDRVGYHR